MKMQRWAWVLLIAAAVLAGCGTRGGETLTDATPVDADGTPLPTLPPPPPAGRAIVADGQLESPYPSLPLGFGGEVSGQVLSITVKAGDVVEAGDLLALLDDTELQRAVGDAQLTLDRAVADHEQALEQWERDLADAEQALAEAERALATARLEYSDTSLEEARTNLDRAQQEEADAEEEHWKAKTWWYPPAVQESTYNRWQRAIRERELAEMRLADAEDSQGVSYLESETREEDVAQAERELAVLEGGIEPSYERAVEDAESELAQAQEALTYARLTAPWSAIVLSVDVAPGATVGAGTPVVTLLNIKDGLRFVTQNLSEQHITDIYPGQQAIVTLRTYAETPLEGTVEAVVPQVEETAEADAHFTVHIQLAPTDPASGSGQSLRLLPGLTGRVEILTED